MRIQENHYSDAENYSVELKERVEQVFEYSCQIVKLKDLLAKIKNKSVDLQKLFMTQEEQSKNTQAMDFFDNRMKSMIYCTLQNMQKYQLYGWEELIYDGDIDNETVN